MGQKVHPYGLRLGINCTWKSRWYANPKNYVRMLKEDLAIRRAIEGAVETRGADVVNVNIIRQPQHITIVIYTASPGVIIGAKGSNVEKLNQRLQKVSKEKLQLKIREIKRPETHAQLIAYNVAQQLRGRVAFKRTMKMAVTNAMRAGVQGIKIRIAGRLGGHEISRVETHKEGRVPLHTLRANIDYGFAESRTNSGTIGVKVWVCTGDIMGSSEKVEGRTRAGKVLAKRRTSNEAPMGAQ